MAPLPVRGCPPSSSGTTPPLLPSSPSISAFLASHPALTLLHTQCATMARLRQLHGALVKSGLAKDPIAASRVVAFLAGKGRDVAYAARLVRHHPRPNAFMWNTAIRALSDGPGPDAAVALFLDMLRSPTPPERRTFPSLFASYARLGVRADDDGAGAALHGMVLKLGLAGDAYVRNSMIAMYASWGRADEALLLYGQCGQAFDVVACNSAIVALTRAGRVDEAREVFDAMPARTVATWSAMVSAYSRAARCQDAVELFSAMQASGVEPNANVLVSVLGCCAALGALEQGAWVHAYIDKHGVAMNALVVTALVDMYCKCGSIHKARHVFDASRSQGLAKLSSWNAMMLGLAVHGQCQEALALFSELETYGLSPDNVTFITILMAYGHSGMADEAKALFSAMEREYAVTPGIEHYGCLVDALARAGRLGEAEDVIRTMPMRPDTAIWGALLSGCRLHGDAEAGARAASGAMECDPQDSGAYVLAASVLARDGEVGAGVSVRERMRVEGVAKVPGCSMIEVNGVVHEFVS